ncbi:MAG: hypothetical protein HY778_14890 [Betaproteobacteria bacterium]|nr:hypothetical protein [Betaproteobacteria bacterium]
MSKAWKLFPHADKTYEYGGAALKKNWQRLHRGDREPFPDAAGLDALVAANAGLEDSAGDPVKAAAALQEAWRCFHAGAFEEAARRGLEMGLLGYVVANKATAIHANYLETSVARKLELFREVVRRSEALMAAAPAWANAFYLHAYALGRYSQGISVVKALAQGLGGRIRDALTRTLKLQPDHADAHIALGTYHAEVIDKVGAMVGGLTYGASKDAGVAHFRKALELNPDSAIARIECANGLVMMYGKSKLPEASHLYEEAARCRPADAMERLDVESAISELEE